MSELFTENAGASFTVGFLRKTYGSCEVDADHYSEALQNSNCQRARCSHDSYVRGCRGEFALDPSQNHRWPSRSSRITLARSPSHIKPHLLLLIRADNCDEPFTLNEFCETRRQHPSSGLRRPGTLAVSSLKVAMPVANRLFDWLIGSRNDCCSVKDSPKMVSRIHARRCRRNSP